MSLASSSKRRSLLCGNRFVAWRNGLWGVLRAVRFDVMDAAGLVDFCDRRLRGVPVAAEAEREEWAFDTLRPKPFLLGSSDTS